MRKGERRERASGTWKRTPDNCRSKRRCGDTSPEYCDQSCEATLRTASGRVVVLLNVERGGCSALAVSRVGCRPHPARSSSSPGLE